MDKLGSLACVVVAALLGASDLTINIADAQEQCREGWYFNGYMCAPAQPDGRYYGPPGAILPGDRAGYESSRQLSTRNCSIFHGRQICCPPGRSAQEGRRHRPLCCPLGWTVQAGVCKPYRGY